MTALVCSQYNFWSGNKWLYRQDTEATIPKQVYDRQS